ncbi:hypothetical protein [Zhongshania marina]|uniref:hypothetical protein n=1 Tax=Zhongshania marina TaxID=2304603 RepID=UPI00296EE8E0
MEHKDGGHSAESFAFGKFELGALEIPHHLIEEFAILDVFNSIGYAVPDGLVIAFIAITVRSLLPKWWGVKKTI